MLYMLGGVAIGTAVGILAAPQSGERTRRQFRRTVEDVRDHAIDLREDVADKVEDLRRSVARQIDTGREYIDEKKGEFVAGFSGLQRPFSALRRRLGWR